MASPLPLEGDGWIENLFYFLWCKDDFGAGPRIFIPHTVVYRATQPSAWYFTSLRTGKIKKKSTVNVNNVQIEHTFAKNKSSTDIVAYYMYLQPSASSPASNSEDSPRGQAIIEYFDIEMLRTFLYKREKTHNGMLQKFVLPKGTGSATIRAIWSPKICLLERRVNLKNLYDKRYGVYDRGVTFDGPDLYSRSEPVRGAMLPGEVQTLCETVVDHVTQVSYHKYRISRMVLHLRSDADDRLWLLWCSSLRLVKLNASESTATMRPLDIVNDAQVPAFVQFGQQPQPSMLLQHEQSEWTSSSAIVAAAGQCLSCGMHMDRNRLLQTTYKAIVEHFTRFIKFLRSTGASQTDQQVIEWPPDPRFVAAAGGVGFGIISFMEGCNNKPKKPSPAKGAVPLVHHSISHRELIIPPVIQYLHPTFSVDDFERHRSDPIFLHKSVAVCEDCCLVYADYSTTALEVNSIRQSGPAILRTRGEISDAKKRLDPLDPFSLALSQSSPNLIPSSLQNRTTKPPASAWKPIPASKGVTSKLKRDDSNKAHKSLSTLLTAPQLPQRIESFESVHGATFDNGLNNGDQVHQREETFFRELYSQKDLEKGHPLHHMLNPKLGTNTLASSNGLRVTKSQSMGVLADISTKITGKSPYSIVQRLRNAADHESGTAIDIKEVKKPISTKKTQQQAKKSKPSSSTTGKEKDGMQKGHFVSQREKQASAEHQEFLFAALSEAQAQVSCLSLHLDLETFSHFVCDDF